MVFFFGVKEFDWPAQSHDFNPIHPLWDEVEANAYHLKTVFHLTNAATVWWENLRKVEQKYGRLMDIALYWDAQQ